ncbi:MAG: rhomboid family intramembrane serine protease [Pseudomonadota bacterium]
MVVWSAVAVALGQSPLTSQHSRDLVAFGAFKGADLDLADGWRLVASQWLHVKAPHMLLNAMVIGVVGTSSEARHGRILPALMALVGGCVGQFASAIEDPTAFVSGASQAYLALCGFALVAGGMRWPGVATAVIGVAIAVALDLFVAAHGGIKPGHFWALVFGVAAGTVVRFRRKPS